ncbi:hypothetical protein [Nocardia mexicana]|uniref:Uncharacterized protein n=1 Tax=Nocardia mexicana TaxID=279262 RepID=A0A370HA05_9NOCA|nr:hypothetical protein [Nocardia mexicana]RDI53070.1 hypothetical protein DFR68_103458 [Nocardia mexicana]
MFKALLVLDILQGAIHRVDPADGTVTTVVDDAGSFPDGLAYDPFADRVYWTTMGQPARRESGEPDFTARDGSVESAALDGSDRRTVLPPGALTTGKQLAADFVAGHLFWSDREGCRVSRADLDGANRTDLIVNSPASGKDAECVGVAVDAGAGALYWTQKGPAKGGRGRIFQAGLEVPPGERPETRTDIETLWSGLPEPIDLWLDARGGHLYWTDRGAAPDGNSLNRAPVPAPGEPGGPPQILARGFREAIGLTVDLDAGLAYVTDLGGQVRAVALDGTADRVVAKVDGGALTGIEGI